jgi:hypothetical protein
MIRIIKSLAVLSLLISSAAYATTYTFIGSNYEYVRGAHTTSMKVTAHVGE